MKLVLCLAAVLLAVTFTSHNAQALEDVDLTEGGHVIMLRHALAPGTGDPADFQIGDCTTQRNLNDTGRAQARQIGETLRDLGIVEPRVYSSQWCRCLETAELLGFGEIIELPAINSFFRRYDRRDPQTDELRAFLAEQDPDGDTLILVTHQVNITAITGRGVSSGEAEVFKLNGTGEPEFVGSIAPPR